MDQKQTTFFRELDSTFRTPGWVHLTAGWKEEMEAIPFAAFYNAKSMEELEAARIRYQLLNSLVELPDHHERARLEVEREEDDG